MKKPAPLGPKYEREPVVKVPPVCPPDAKLYYVQDGDNWWNVAERLDYADPWELIFFNFQTYDPREVNWYLREYVGCRLPTPDRTNWRFSADADPGVIFYQPREVRHPVPPKKPSQPLPPVPEAPKMLLRIRRRVWGGPSETVTVGDHMKPPALDKLDLFGKARDVGVENPFSNERVHERTLHLVPAAAEIVKITDTYVGQVRSRILSTTTALTHIREYTWSYPYHTTLEYERWFVMEWDGERTKPPELKIRTTIFRESMAGQALMPPYRLAKDWMTRPGSDR